MVTPYMLTSGDAKRINEQLFKHEASLERDLLARFQVQEGDYKLLKIKLIIESKEPALRVCGELLLEGPINYTVLSAGLTSDNVSLMPGYCWDPTTDPKTVPCKQADEDEEEVRQEWLGEQLAKTVQKLQDPDFLNSAPIEVINAERQRLNYIQGAIRRLPKDEEVMYVGDRPMQNVTRCLTEAAGISLTIRDNKITRAVLLDNVDSIRGHCDNAIIWFDTLPSEMDERCLVQAIPGKYERMRTSAMLYTKSDGPTAEEDPTYGYEEKEPDFVKSLGEAMEALPPLTFTVDYKEGVSIINPDAVIKVTYAELGYERVAKVPSLDELIANYEVGDPSMPNLQKQIENLNKRGTIYNMDPDYKLDDVNTKWFDSQLHIPVAEEAIAVMVAKSDAALPGVES